MSMFKTQPDWIKSQDRLPPEDDWVLAYNGDFIICRRDSTLSGDWTDQENRDLFEPDFWTPLPWPPEN